MRATAPLPALSIGTNPFREGLALRLDLAAPSGVVLDVYDLFGRHLAHRDYGPLGGGAHALTWDGYGPNGSVPSGPYWVRVTAADQGLREPAQHVTPGRLARVEHGEPVLVDEHVVGGRRGQPGDPAGEQPPHHRQVVSQARGEQQLLQQAWHWIVTEEAATRRKKQDAE